MMYNSAQNTISKMTHDVYYGYTLLDKELFPLAKLWENANYYVYKCHSVYIVVLNFFNIVRKKYY